MVKVKQIDIKNRTYYFYNDRIDLKDFNARWLKVYHLALKGDCKEIDIYYIGYVTVEKMCKSFVLND